MAYPSMRAVEISRPGGPEVLRPVSRPKPQVGMGELLIRVAAAGVSRPDILQREGHYPPPPGASDLPGLEVAGTVEAVGEDVSDWSVGDRVCALLAGGGYAEYAVAPVVQVLPLPSTISFVEGAALPENFFTVWDSLFERARLSPGETLLVHGAAGGIGSTAVLLGNALGSRVFGTASGFERCRAVEALGAKRAFDRTQEDVALAFYEASAGRGADVILDLLAGDTVDANLSALALDGRLVLLSTLGGTRACFDVLALLKKRATILGSTLRARSPREKGRVAAGLRARIWPLLEARALTIPIDSSFPLEHARAAHERLESRTHIGKIVLEI